MFWGNHMKITNLMLAAFVTFGGTCVSTSANAELFAVHAEAAAPTATPVSTSTPAATTTPASTSTPVSTSTPAPTATASASAAPTAAPEATATPTAAPTEQPSVKVATTGTEGKSDTAAPSPSQPQSVVDMYRLYNPYTGEHFYTSSADEKDYLYSIGWGYEGVGWQAPVTSDAPVYRLYNSVGSEHHYTGSASERDTLINDGWNYEGIAWYSETANTSYPVYRQYDPNEFSCNHNFSEGAGERDHLVSLGWHDEGVAWYAATDYVNQLAEAQYKIQPRLVENHDVVIPPYYSQLDGRWSANDYGGYSLGRTGCGVTALAMIISARIGREVLPNEMGDYLYAAGVYNNGKASLGYIGTNGSTNMAAGEHYGVPVTCVYTLDDLDRALRHGYLVCFEVGADNSDTYCPRGCTHSIVLYGYGDSGLTNVLDPLGGRCNGVHSIADIWNNHTNDPTDLDLGAPGFAF